jgi:hypothetical protein
MNKSWIVSREKSLTSLPTVRKARAASLEFTQMYKRISLLALRKIGELTWFVSEVSLSW